MNFNRRSTLKNAMTDLQKKSLKIDNAQASYEKIITSIKNKIWLHNNKKEFLRKTSIIYYLNTLSSIETTNRPIILAKDKYKNLLKGIMKEIEGYENIVVSENDMSLNLINVSQDILRLKNVEQTEYNDETAKHFIKAYNFEEKDSLTNISDIVLTNDNFQYSDLPAIPKKNEFQKPSDASIDIFPSTNTNMSSGAISKQKNIPKKMHSHSGVSIMDSTSCNSQYDNFSEKRKVSNTEDTYLAAEVEENPFSNPKVAKQWLEELNSKIDAFKRSVLSDIDEIVAENKARKNKVETQQKTFQINPFFFNKNDPISPATQLHETNRTSTPPESFVSCEELAYVFTKMHKELLDSSESDSEI